MIRIIFRHEWINLVRSKAKLAFILMLVVASAYAVHYGNRQINKQKNNIAFAESECINYKIDGIKNLEGDTTKWQYRIASRPGFARWRHPHAAAMNPTEFATLSIGQRDLNPYFHNLTGLSLYMQLFKSEISNPQKLLAGNFDFSFIIIYLLPLLIIVLSYGLISEEKEQGTFSLLVIQSGSIRKIVLLKFLFYIMFTSALLIGISFAAFIYSGINVIANFKLLILWLASSLCYMLFWFGAMLLLLAFNKSTAFNALAALTCWIFFLIIIPSLTNNIVATSHHISNSHLSGLTRRRAFSDLSDKGTTEQIRGFLSRHPELQKDSLVILSGDKGGKAYASFVEKVDIDAYPIVQAYKSKIINRNNVLATINCYNPAVNTQMIFNKIACTDLHTFYTYQEALVDYHKTIVDRFQNGIFYNQRLHKEDYLAGAPIFQYHSEVDYSSIFNRLLLLGITAMSLLLFGLMNIKDRTLIN